MVLDINLFRTDKGGDPEKIRDNQRKRFKDPGLVDQVIEADNEWKTVRFKIDEFNRLKNASSKLIGKKMKSREDPGVPDLPDSITASADDQLFQNCNDQLGALTINQLKSISALVDTRIEANKENLKTLEKKRYEALSEIANFLEPGVPISNNEDENGLLRTWPEPGSDAGVATSTTVARYSHIDLIQMIDGVDLERGAKVAGGRGYFLKGACVFLEQALISLGTQQLVDADYELLSPPVFMRKDRMREVAQLTDFEETLYKVVSRTVPSSSPDQPGGSSEVAGGDEEKFLIATSEQPIAAFHADDWMPTGQLPIRYAGISNCYRQEAGAHGRDQRGIFRVHQFQKVEQFWITSPFDGQSTEALNAMIHQAQQFYQTLSIPYRVVAIVSGELNNAAAIKYDLEGWFPGSSTGTGGSYRELVSCSNCTDYQSRRLKIRYGETKKMSGGDAKTPGGGEHPFVHMLNGTLCATTRVICAVLENWQRENGIEVPPPLRPFMPNKYKEFIPFVKKAPIDTKN